jgi:hypothetical protein
MEGNDDIYITLQSKTTSLTLLALQAVYPQPTATVEGERQGVCLPPSHSYFPSSSGLHDCDFLSLFPKCNQFAFYSASIRTKFITCDVYRDSNVNTANSTAGNDLSA